MLRTLLLCLLAFNVFAEEHKPRIALPEETETYVDRTAGFAIDLPRRFKLVAEEDDLLYFQSFENYGTVIVRPMPDLTLSDIQMAMRGGVESRRAKLKTHGSPLTLNLRGGQGMTMEVKGTIDDVEVTGYLAGILGANQRGYMVLAGASLQRWGDFRLLAVPILESFTIGPVVDGVKHERWQQRLMGAHLAFATAVGGAFSGAGYNSDYFFCSDGTFRQNTGASDSWGGAYYQSYSYSESNDSGTWRVIGGDGVPTLSLSYKGGAQDYSALTAQDGYIFLDDFPYQPVPNTLCE